MVFKSRQVKMIPTMLVIFSVGFGGVMTYFFLSMGLADASMWFYLMSMTMGVVIIMLPIMLPVMIAADSIVGEKERHTLVPLLSTPLTDAELLLGKYMTALVPGILVAYGNLLLVTLLANGMTFFLAPHLTWIWPNILSLLQALVMPVLFAFMSVGIMIVISGKANTVYEAYQSASIIIVPAMLFSYSTLLQGSGLDWTIFIVGSIVLLLVGLGLYKLAIRLFSRDELMTRR